ncbi:MAG TPA: heme-binding protein [Alphaproteobacteria bacterium]|nr:heme-binding protein [Alphaproteobacteria bacterium]
MPCSFRHLALPAAVAAFVACAAPVQAQLIQHRDISYAMALTIVTGALDACKAMGYAASAVVVDRDGETIVAIRGDGVGPHTVENARRKAYTALTFKMTTQQFIDAMKTQPTRREQTTLPSVIAINGGVPIKVGQEVIGGAGLSGSPGRDEECVNAGLEKVKQFLQ